MPIAHPCQGCGHDLARLRPRAEPRYGLPIVRCPCCERAAVRRRHPTRRVLHALLRVDAALSVLLIQVLLAAAAVGTSVVLAIVLSVGLGEDLFSNGPHRSVAEIFGIVMSTAAFVGTWVEAGLRQHGRLRSWGWWFVVVPGLAGLAAGSIAATGVAAEQIAVGWPIPLQFALVAGAAGVVMAVSSGLSLAALACSPLGRLLVMLHRGVRSIRLRWRVRQRHREGASP